MPGHSAGGRRQRPEAGEPALWIFAYGSLLWRPAFSFVARHAARIEGWQRRFWQGSTDHRGVPGAPGRVVTLLPDAQTGAAGAPAPPCHGVVYGVASPDVDAVLAQLDHRERGGYRRIEVAATLGAAGAGRRVPVLTYAATKENPNYLGPAAAHAIARQVCAARGPSGPNVEYVLELAAALRAIGATDPHVFEIEQAVRRAKGRAA